MNLGKIKNIYFVGIGGAGMSGIADILIEEGYNVSGSDRESSEATVYLRSRGANIFIGHNSENLKDADLLVFSSAIPDDNPEVIQAKKMNIPCIKRAEMLGYLMKNKKGIAVAGTHGKTTTTAMIGHMLISCGLDPTIIVGGKMQNSATNARLGHGKYFVTEADEYDRSFLTLFPETSVINNIEEDHLDIYKNIGDLKQTFLKFARQTMSTGVLIINLDNQHTADIAKDCGGKILSFAINKNADVRAENIRFKKGKTYFDVIANSDLTGTIHLNLPGQHNIYNALAAIATGLHLQLSFDDIKKALAEFKGVQRRFEFKGEINGIYFFDDYAHHPTEVEAAISAAKSGWHKRVIVIFQPHLFSRTKDFYHEFALALGHADRTILAPVYPAREQPLTGVTSALIAGQMDEKCICVQRNDMLVDAIIRTIQKDDLVITMGAGDIWKYGEKALKKLRTVN